VALDLPGEMPVVLVEIMEQEMEVLELEELVVLVEVLLVALVEVLLEAVGPKQELVVLMPLEELMLQVHY